MQTQLQSVRNMSLEYLRIKFTTPTNLTVEPNATKIDRGDEHQEYRDPDSWVDRIVPKLNQGRRGTDLCWHGDGHRVP
jgi:hypothetical protein